MIIRRPDKSCNQSDLRTHQSRNPKRTSGHLKVEILNGPLDTSKLQNSNPTSGHQKKWTIEVSRGRFRNLWFHAPPARSSTRKACKIYWFSLRLQHIKKFEAISKQRPLTGQGLEALFQNSPKKFNVFLAWFYRCFVNYEQRHRRRTTHFARATAPQTYYMFC